MARSDLQLGGGYTYQWRSAILLALNYFFEPVSYDDTLHELVGKFGQVEAVHLEGELRPSNTLAEEGREQGAVVELEDINLMFGTPGGADARCILIQAKTREAGNWKPGDEPLRKALYRFYRNPSLDRKQANTCFVFLSNRQFSEKLDALSKAIEQGKVAECPTTDELYDGVCHYAGGKEHVEDQQGNAWKDLDKDRFVRMLARTALVDFLDLDQVKANVQAKLQGYGRSDWSQAYDRLFARFAELSTQAGGGLVTRELMTEILGPAVRPGSIERLAPSPHMLRPLVGDFTGRTKEIESLMGYLSKADKTGCIAVICGMGGVGKSELALKVADRLRERHPDTDLMFELQPGGQGLTPEEVLATVVRAFRPEEKLSDDLAGLQAMYRQVMTGKRGLLLLDNAAGPEQVRPLLPAAAGWAVLVTTRMRFSLPGAKLCDLELFPLDDAVALLYPLFGDGGRDDLVQAQEGYRETHPEAAQLWDSPLGELAELCGRLPLAMRVAAGHLTSYTDVPLDHYLKQLGTARRKHLAAPGEPDVAAVLGLSVQRLEAEDPSLARRWRELAVFPAPFDWTAAAAVWGELAATPADDVRVWPALKPLTEEETRAALSALVQRNLAEYERETATYSLHDLLREWALDTTAVAMLEGPRMCHAWHYLRMGNAANDLYEQGGEQMVEGLRRFEAAWPHLAAAFAGLQGRQDRDAIRWLNEFPNAVADVLDLRVTSRRKISFLKAAVGAAQQLGDRQDAGNHLGNLGAAYAALGEAREAIEYYEEAMAISREFRDRRGESVGLGNLGAAYAALGEARRAIEYYEQALAISREISDRWGESANLNNLGPAYVALGETQRAIEYYEEALAISQKLGDRRCEGDVLNNLGLAYAALGEMRQAIGYYKDALVISQELGDRRGEGNRRGNLGLAYAALGEVPRAIEYYDEALAISREIEDQHGEGNHLGNLGLAYAALGEVPRAIEYYDEALAISRVIEDRHGEGNHLNNLGLAYAALGEVQRAIGYYKDALVISQELGDRRREGCISATWA